MVMVMVKLIENGVYVAAGKVLQASPELAASGCGHLPKEAFVKETARQQTMAYQILSKHNTSGTMDNLKVRFDALTSHDITYVGIIQTAVASGLQEFPVPYALTNCHNSLSAVGGTINEDDHAYGYSAARKFGGIYVPAHQAVIHQYAREMLTGGGKMILGSDSHTRYGALGTMAIGEGGPELVKQLLKRTYDVAYPGVIAIYLEGTPKRGVGPQDVALAIIGAVFKNAFVKNKVMEFVGPGIEQLSIDFRNGIDVMTTETTCLTTIWKTDDKVKDFYTTHGRPADYVKVEPGEVSYYDGAVIVDLSKVEPMIAVPFHPSNTYTIAEFNANAVDILRKVEQDAKEIFENPNLNFKLTDKLVNGRLKVDQGVVAGCAGGTFENVANVAAILQDKAVGDFSLSVYPSSQPVFLELMQRRDIEAISIAGASIRSAFCGPCFGAGDVPVNNGLSIRHTTRNFPNREGSKPAEGQIASVALMDARSIAATAANGGFLTAATDVEYTEPNATYHFNGKVYENRVYQGFGKAEPQEELVFGPNIKPWPTILPLADQMILKMAAVIHDPVTTTDELIPSGETSSFRSNPLRLAEFTLSRKDPQYVGRAKAVQGLEANREAMQAGESASEELKALMAKVTGAQPEEQALKDWAAKTTIGSVIFAVKPGDGSAREQAASSQRVLGASANIAIEYATKRYRSNLINWGMVPFTVDKADEGKFAIDDYIFIPNMKEAIASGADSVAATILRGDEKIAITLKLENLSQDDRKIILTGCLMNYYAQE